jgi:ligand-binding sensor domain-containing protein
VDNTGYSSMPAFLTRGKFATSRHSGEFAVTAHSQSLSTTIRHPAIFEHLSIEQADKTLALSNKIKQQLKKYLHHPIYALLLMVCFFTSCKGQTKTQADSVNTTTTTVVGQPKMIRTQGTDYTQVGCGFQDKEGNLWFGTLNEGVFRYDGKTFTQFTIKDGLGDNDVKAIIEDKAGNVLFGTNRGIYKYDGKKIINIPITDTLSITSLLEDREGNIWFGVMNKGIYRYDGTHVSNFLYKYVHPVYGDKNEKYISDILQDKNGNIWFSSWNGGGAWRYDGKSFKNFLPSALYYQTNEDGRDINRKTNETMYSIPQLYSIPQETISDDMIFSMTEDKKGNIWFATRRHGACRYDGKSFTSFREQEGFVSYGISSIIEDKKGNMWFATGKNGVYCYDGKTFKNFTEKDGLVNNDVWFALEDKSGNLWFGTRGFGLSQYDGKTFTTFSDYK